MAKVVKVEHAIATWNLTAGSAPGGLTKVELDALVDNKLAEGWDLRDVFVVKTNFGERGDVTHLTNEYVFVKYEESAAKAK